jgi:hypothetical protein
MKRLLLATVLGGLLASASSASADPTKDECIAANESAQDLRQAGKLREARQKLTLCLAASCPGLLRQDCAQRLTEVDKAMPAIVFEAKDGAGNDLSAVRVTMDGQPLVAVLDGSAIPVDPGQHTFAFEGAGFLRSETTLVLQEGERDRHQRVVLVAVPLEPASGAPAQTSGTPPSPEPSTEGPTSDGSTRRLVGLALGGAGVVGLVVGSVLGLVSKSTYNHALGSECGSAAGYADVKTCNATGYHDVQSAFGQATASTVSFVAGVGLLGGGGYLYFTAPKGPQVSVGPTVGTGSAGVSLRGSW